MKRFISLFLMLAFLFSIVPTGLFSITANAATIASGTCGENLTWSLLDGGTLIFYGSGPMTNYESESDVPWYGFKSSIKILSFSATSNVTSIGDRAFYGCSGLTRITIPNSVTSIGERAFSFCSGLTGIITIPNGVTIISEGVFWGCSGLTNITIPNSVTSIGGSAFFGCSNLTNITIPDSVTSMGSYLFYNCSGLTNITIPNSVTSIGSCLFYNCSGLTNITIPDSVTSIGGSAFSHCSGLTGITIPNSVTSIGGSAFSHCSGLTGITIPNSVTSIVGSAFSHCSGLTSITIPNSVTSIGSSLFYNCSGLTNITIPNSVTSIGGSAFKDCSNLTNITIPTSVTSIGSNAFDGCTNLATVNYLGSIEQWSQISIDAGNTPLTSAELVYKCSMKHTMTEATCTTPEICQVCGYIAADALGHTWDTTQGTYRQCTVCGYCEGDPLPEYTITYHLDGGTNALKNPETYTSEDVIKLKDPSKVGYDFKGWFLDSNMTQPIAVIVKQPGGLNVYAKFTPKAYTATFKDAGVTRKCAFDGYITAPSVSKTGYNLIGWYDVQGNKMPEIWKYTEDRTFTAKWEPKKYIITYHLNGGTNSSLNPAYYTIEDTVTFSVPYKRGHTFDGWYFDSKFTEMATDLVNQTGNVVLYAKYTVNSYTLTIDGTGGAIVPKITFISDGVVVKSAYLGEEDSLLAYRPEEKERYIFGGWYTNRECTALFAFSGEINDNTTLYAKWIPWDGNIINPETNSTFNVTIQGKNEQIYAFVPLANGTITVTSESFNMDLFGSLYDSSKNLLISADDIGSNDLDFSYSYNVKAGQLYYVSVKGNTSSTNGSATIVIGWNGSCQITGSTYSEKTTSVVYDQTYILPQKPLREGYVFLGWFDENDTQITDGTWNFVTDKTLTAKWEEATYHTVIFKDVDGNILSEDTYYLSEDLVAPELPTKAPDNTYTYTAKWNNNYTGVCTGDAVYQVVFEKTYVDYTVVFKNWDGSVLSTQIYHYGDMVTSPTNPSKEADETYTYTFAGWDKAVVPCAGDATYTATYTADYVEYTVVFKNWDGTVLSTKTYHYGDNVALPQNPTKGADHIYNYIFAGWDKEVVDCIGDAVYTATYTTDYVTYTVVFKNWDGSVLSTNTYHYGDGVAVPANPTKVADKTYTYTFAGWDKAVGACVGNETYTATYTSNHIEYTVVFKNWDGTVLLTKTYHYGDVVTVPETPTKEADNTYTYTFASWDKAVVDCAGDAIYTATYTTDYVDYTVVFKNWDGSVLSAQMYHYGDMVIAPQNPTKAADQIYGYTFAGWDKAVGVCVGNETYTATYTSHYIDYTVVFKNWDGSVLSAQMYHYGDMVIAPQNPTKVADQIYGYTFAGWDKAVGVCVGNETYTATYTSHYIDYTVVFKNWDGSVLSAQMYHYGDMVIAPQNPTKVADQIYGYTFAGWDKAIGVCIGNATYIATYTATYIDYTVVFEDWDGSVLSTKMYHYGDVITVPTNLKKAADHIYTYIFAGWDKQVGTCVGDVTYTATYTTDYVDYTVVFKNWDGSVLSTKTYHYGERVTAPTTPTKDADKTYTYAFAGWDKAVGACVGNATYTATYTATYIDYTVVFKDWDGTVLSTNSHHYGEAVQEPATPVKGSDLYGTYVFTGWDSPVTICTGDKTYTAVYKVELYEYTIKFQNWDGTVISSKIYHYNDEVTVPNAPVRAANDTYTYTFAGWDKEVTNCAGNTTYTATYTATYIDYTVVFKDWDGTVLSTNTYHWGDEVTVPAEPIRPDDKEYMYTFAGWDNQVTLCEDNRVYTATYNKTEIVVTSIEIATLPSKITYSQGEEFDPIGMVVTVTYNNGTSEVITDYTLEGYSSTPGEKTITVTYGNQSATFQVVVETSSLGDVNEDGKIDAKDALAVLKISVGKTEPTQQQKSAADVNGDGQIGAKDALEILKYAVGKPSALDKAGA